MKTMLEPETNSEIACFVRSGFYERERLKEIFCEEMYAPGELDPDDVAAAIDAEIAKWESEKSTWPHVTDCDRLDSVFDALNDRGIIALQNAGYTQGDGYDDFLDMYDAHPDRASVLGYCFYHGQDLERAVRGEGLNLAFGPVDASHEETLGPKVGDVIREEFERAGFTVDWDGTFSKRIRIPDLVWQKR
jgi:hypothetical protein